VAEAGACSAQVSGGSTVLEDHQRADQGGGRRGHGLDTLAHFDELALVDSVSEFAWLGNSASMSVSVNVVQSASTPSEVYLVVVDVVTDDLSDGWHANGGTRMMMLPVSGGRSGFLGGQRVGDGDAFRQGSIFDGHWECRWLTMRISTCVLMRGSWSAWV